MISHFKKLFFCPPLAGRAKKKFFKMRNAASFGEIVLKRRARRAKRSEEAKKKINLLAVAKKKLVVLNASFFLATAG